MSEEAKGGAPKKLTTAEIMAMARAKKAGAAGEAKPAEPAAAAEPAPAAEAPATPAAPAAKPKSTADILAAARASKAAAGGAPVAEEKPAAKPAAAKPAGAPKSTADILAAARAAKAGAAAAPAASGEEKPAAKPAAKAAVATGAAAGMSVQEMLAKMRPAEPGAAKVAEPVAITAAPPMPPKPAPAASKKPGAKADADASSRRGFFMTALAGLFTAWWMAWAAFTAAASIGGLGVLRFMLPNVLTEPPRKFKIGPPGDYDLGTVATKWVAQYGVWIVHSDQYHNSNLIYALISVCTHLGCTPSWLEGEQKFKCPCHGSGFYITGINFEGPAPRPLERAAIRIAEDGMLEVDKSVKFQEEMGQWEDPNSFVAIS